MKYCKKCLYPDTKPQLTFDKNGICSACLNNELKNQVDWDKKNSEFSLWKILMATLPISVHIIIPIT